MAEDWLSVRLVSQIGLGLAGGAAVACLHLEALAVNVRLYMTPGSGWRPVGLHVARVAAVAAGFAAAALIGPAALLAMLAGFTLGRAVALGRHR